jgi:hypothetical protein
MKRTPWLLLLIGSLMAAAIVFFQRAAVFDSKSDVAPSLLLGLYTWAQPRAGTAIILLAIGTAFVQAVEKGWGIHRFRKDVHTRFLDQILLELFDNNGLENRVTLFKAVRGFQAIPSFLYRWVFFAEDRFRLLGMLPLNPFGSYLIVYARCAKSANPRSCSMFRVYSQSPERCEGFAGLVWSTDFAVTRNLPNVKERLRKLKRKGDIKDVTKPGHALRRYAVESNLTTCAKLRAVNRFAQHFFGTALWTGGGKKWGVLVVDSTANLCPFPETDLMMADELKSYAKSLTNTLE